MQARWCRRLCRLLGLKIRVEGEALPAPGPMLVVANHISWLDVPVIASLLGVGFLSKSEVRRWPLIGAVATGLGTLYIERGRKDAAGDAAEAMRERMKAGHPVLFFPEGTTSDGSGLLPFRPRLYQSAVDADAPVRPLTLSYHRPDGSLCLEASFTNNQRLLFHLIRLCAEPALYVRVRIGVELRGQGRTELARASRAEMERLLETPELGRTA